MTKKRNQVLAHQIFHWPEFFWKCFVKWLRKDAQEAFSGDKEEEELCWQCMQTPAIDFRWDQLGKIYKRDTSGKFNFTKYTGQPKYILHAVPGGATDSLSQKRYA